MAHYSTMCDDFREIRELAAPGGGADSTAAWHRCDDFVAEFARRFDPRSSHGRRARRSGMRKTAALIVWGYLNPPPIISKTHALNILDTCEWDCDLLFEHEQWSDGQDGGLYIVSLIELAREHERVLTGFTEPSPLAALFDAVCISRRVGDVAADFIVGRGLRVPADYVDESSDAIAHLMSVGYDPVGAP